MCLVRNVCLPFGSVRASRRLHEAMTSSVLRARVSWFDSTPLGRVLNRFASDIAAIDKDEEELRSLFGFLFKASNKRKRDAE